MKLSEFKEIVIAIRGKEEWECFKEKEGYIVYTATEEYKKKFIQINGCNIQYIDNPTEEMKYIAVSRNSSSIRHIDNPSEELQLLAVEKIPYDIQYIDNPSEKVQLKAVEQDPVVINIIKNPTERVIKTAIMYSNFHNYEYILKHIKNDLKEGKENEV